MTDNELWQAYDEQGQPIPGRGLTKPEARSGMLHGASHVWLWRQKSANAEQTEFLLQKRADTVSTWPGYYDVSAAGHINTGEQPLTAAIRETREEIGVAVEPSDLRLLFVYRQRLEVPSNGMIENEFQWVYGLRVQSDETLDYADGEVESATWIDAEELDALISGEDKTSILIVPHGGVYFSNLLEQIEHAKETN